MVSFLRIAGLALFVALAAGCAHRPAPVAAPSQGGYFQGNQGTQYGVVHSIDRVRAESQTSGGGAVVGGAIGGLIGNQIEHGHKKAIATTVGVVAGAIIGNQVEKNRQGRQDIYRVTVQVERGGHRSFDYASLDNLRVGDRVRIENNQLYRW
jgi:outer membrane lipoprotein SlyB